MVLCVLFKINYSWLEVLMGICANSMKHFHWSKIIFNIFSPSCESKKMKATWCKWCFKLRSFLQTLTAKSGAFWSRSISPKRSGNCIISVHMNALFLYNSVRTNKFESFSCSFYSVLCFSSIFVKGALVPIFIANKKTKLPSKLISLLFKNQGIYNKHLLEREE